MARDRQTAPGRTSHAATVTAGVALFGVALAVTWHLSHSNDPTGVETPPATTVNWRDVLGDSLGTDTRPDEPDEADAAAAAAVSYATVSQNWLYFTDEQIVDAVAEIATPDAAEELAADAVAEVSAARAALSGSPGRVWWLVRPMAWKVESLRANEASVDVWTVTVLSAEEVAAPQSEWVTVTVDLEWVDDGWKLDALRDNPGPTPMPGPNDAPWDAIPFDAVLAGFTRIDGDPAS